MAKTATSQKPSGSERIPPHSEEAERGVLGSVLLDPGRVIDLCVERGLCDQAFYIPAHRALFELFVAMSQENRPVDLVTAADRLKTLGRLDEIGGHAYLEQLLDGTPTAAHAEYYVDIVYQKYLLRSIIDRSREAIDRCYMSEESAPEVLSRTEQDILEVSGTQRASVTPWPELVKHAMGDIEKIYQDEGYSAGIPTGYKDLDGKLMGMKAGEMLILAARPSMGKTSLALNIAEHVATVHGDDPLARPVAVFSLEMSSDQLVKRMLCSRAKVPSHKLTGGYINEVNHNLLAQAADALMKAPIYLDDTAGLEALELRSRARRLWRKHKIELIIVDYLQMLNFAQYSREGRQRETAAISGTLKSMAKELRIPVLVLSQLSRAPETRDRLAVPKLSDLRDSGSIEQDADVVCLLRRPCKYPGDEDEHDKTLAILDVAKNRNGPTGQIRLNFFEDHTRFESRQEGVDHEPGGEPDSEGFEL